MSFILDALKKSEIDRQAQDSPGIADIPLSAPESGTPRWLPAVLVLLGLNVVLVLFLLLKPSSGEPDAPQRIVLPTQQVPREPVDPARSREQLAANSGSELPDRATTYTPPPVRAPAQTVQSQRTLPSSSAPPVQAAPALPEPTFEAAPTASYSATPQVTPQPAEPAVDEPSLTFNELRATGALSLPDLHIDLHVYSDNPADRLVFINTSQYRENATLSDGPTVRRITPNGVILEYQGTRFLLPRE